jgi:hypothetical protein
LLQNLTDALETSKAKWKIVVGHHTMRSVGKHGETHELLTEVLPILEVCGPISSSLQLIETGRMFLLKSIILYIPNFNDIYMTMILDWLIFRLMAWTCTSMVMITVCNTSSALTGIASASPVRRGLVTKGPKFHKMDMHHCLQFT